MMPKLRPRLPGDRFGPLTDVSPGDGPLTDREKIAQLEQENAELREQLAATNRDLQVIAEYVFGA